MKGCLAAAAVVAAAEPAVSLARRATIDRILDELHEQQGFDLAQAVRGFENSLDRLRADGRAARAGALASLARLAENPDALALLMRVAEAVALADGTPSPEVRGALAEIAAALGQPAPQPPPREAARRGGGSVIVVGNEKGGTGKSTTAIHLAMGLADKGKRVACVDLDGRQGTLSRFLELRARAAKQSARNLVVPRYRRFDAPEAGTGPSLEERNRLEAVLGELSDHDVVVIDTPGHASSLSNAAYGLADVLVTPINDSFIDVDALAEINTQSREVRAPSAFCRLVWEERERRRQAGVPAIDWVVARNRTGHLDTRNAREMTQLLDVLSERLGFRLQPGFSERVVFRGLFFRGLTLFDLMAAELPHGSSASLKNAREEVGDLIEAVVTAAGRNTTGQTE
ncbi:division plane positioning ATPase MipZ [Pelagibius marinus]|uniref:division plane positioning ATPase MipZ n=1 Tax=Pelagibius marinus TaxID=2762760 RepID=UPI0018723EDC|nr:division plane positioning ATPase MipZ [Pelagibius marinus]